LPPARTFVFVRDVLKLHEAGLIKGGNLNNAVVIYEHEIPQEELDKLADLMNSPRHDAKKLGYLNQGGLIYPNEPARHKILDLIGDMALIGKPLKGRIIAKKPGHHINNQLARLIRKDIRLNEVQPPIYDPDTEPLDGYQPHPTNFAASLSFFDGGQNHRENGQIHHWYQKHYGQRALFSRGTSPKSPSCPAYCKWKRWHKRAVYSSSLDWTNRKGIPPIF